MTQSLTLTKPDDWHVHFRDQKALCHTVNATAQTFGRALAMPNLQPPLTSVEMVQSYKERIAKHSPHGFTPYFSLYLTDNIQPSCLQATFSEPDILGAKLYPSGVTTNSKAGITSIQNLYPIFEVMQDLDLVLQIHGETIEDDIFDREKNFIDTQLAPLVKNFPRLRIVLEHISTKAACDFVQNAPNTVAATITIHHLMFNRNDLLAGGIKPHFYCLPILKRAEDQQAVQAAALSGNPHFFLGTDSAPHAIEDKQSPCGCAGIYSAPHAICLYAQFFEQHQKLAALEPFASHFGADFYQLPRNADTITLEKLPHPIPELLLFGDKKVRPLAAGLTIDWKLADPLNN